MSAAADDDGRPPLHYSLWFGVGVLGLLVFAVGVLLGLPGASNTTEVTVGGVVQILIAIAGGAMAYYGFHTWYYKRAEALDPRRARSSTRRERELALAPSFEVYDPKKAVEAPRPPRPPLPPPSDE